MLQNLSPFRFLPSLQRLKYATDLTSTSAFFSHFPFSRMQSPDNCEDGMNIENEVRLEGYASSVEGADTGGLCCCLLVVLFFF